MRYWKQTLAITMAGLMAGACQTLYEELPSAASGRPSPTPTPSTAAPSPGSPSATPTPTPASTPTPSTTPTPSATPTPAPTPTPTPPSASSCALPSGGGSGQSCPRLAPSFLKEVDRAINSVVAKQPALFNLNDQRGEGGYYVKDGDAFHKAVVRELQAQGLCAIYDGEEIGVKDSNSFNDQFDIHISSGHIRRGDGSYRSTCHPAWF